MVSVVVGETPGFTVPGSTGIYIGCICVLEESLTFVQVLLILEKAVGSVLAPGHPGQEGQKEPGNRNRTGASPRVSAGKSGRGGRAGLGLVGAQQSGPASLSADRRTLGASACDQRGQGQLFNVCSDTCTHNWKKMQ